VTANGQTSTQPLKVEKDPRLTEISQADLQEQFDLAMKVRDEVSEADDMVALIRKVKPKADPSTKDTLSTIEEELYQVRNRSNQDPLNFPIKLNNQIAALMRVIETGDAKPTDQSYVVYKELTERLEKLKARLDASMRASKLQP
jgi:vacuolar-type H+-ATPase subunit I/STV1